MADLLGLRIAGAIDNKAAATGTTGGGWPNAGKAMINSTEYASIAAAIAAAAAGDIIKIGQGTFTETLTVDEVVTLVALDPIDTIITSASSATITVTSAGAAFRNLGIRNTAGGGTDSTVVQSNVNNCVYENCILTKTGAADDSACILQYGGTGTQIINCELTTTGATKNYAIWNNTAVVTIEIIGGSLSGTTQDIISDQASTFTMRGVKLVNSLISLTGSGILVGYYVNAAGDVVLVGSSILAGVDKYIISATVATSDLTVALKTLAGTDPTPANPVFVKIGDVVRPITAALSVTALDATNWFNSGSAELATQDVDYFVYLIQETGASAGTKIGFARIPYAETMGDFVNTTTSQYYVKGSWTNFNATDKVTLIGRFNAILSATAAFTWSLTTAVILNHPVFDTRWLAFVPVVTSGGGTITTLGTVTGSYKIAYNQVAIIHAITVTTAGTGTGALIGTLPFSLTTDSCVGAGRENAVTGAMSVGRVVTTTCSWTKYDNSTIIASSAALRGSIPTARL